MPNRGEAMKPIIEKIQKLLALANSSNPHEATLASQRAHELLMRHNLDLQLVEKSKTEYIQEEQEQIYRKAPEEKWVMQILLSFFFVSAIKQGSKFALIGRRENVEVARYVREFLIREFRARWLSFKKANWLNGRSEQRDFYRGIYDGLHFKLELQRKSIEQEKGLVLAKDQALDDHARELANGRVARQSLSATNSLTRLLGEEAGMKIEIRKAIKSSNHQTGNALALEDGRAK